MNKTYHMKRFLTNILTLGAAVAISPLTASAQSTGESDADFKSSLNTIHTGGDRLPQKYDGTGVTVGVLDLGFDPNHVAFSTPGDPSKSRVKAFYLWKNSSFQLQDISGFTTDTGSDYHGTHVAGIAAGGYDGPGQYNDGDGVKTYQNLPLLGVAPNADIVMAGGGSNLTSDQITKGIATLVNTYAASSDKPMVINLSSGDIKGSHSGSGDGVTGSGMASYTGKGPIICVSSGNEGAVKCTVNVGNEDSADQACVGIPFSSSQTDYYIYTTPRLKDGVDPNSALTTDMVQPMQIDFIVYDSTTGKICYSRNLYDLYSTAMGRAMAGSQAAKANWWEANGDFDTWFSPDSYIRLTGCGCINTYGPNLQERSEWRFMISALFKAASDSRYKPGLYISTHKGERAFGYTTAYSGFTSHNVGSSSDTDATVTYPAWREGSSDGSMSALATLDNVIAVGACSATSRTGYLNGNSYGSSIKPGEIWPMSSYGMNTFTGERLPHVVAPGYDVISAVSRSYSQSYGACSASAEYNGDTYYWRPESGTSMSAPFVTGTIALWLQADPELTVADIKDIFKHTNIYPAEIEALPENDERRLRWGGGMIQPLAGLKYILDKNASSGITTVRDDDPLLIEQYGSEIRAFVAGESNLTARLYTITGHTAATANSAGNEIVIDAAGCPQGTYILEVRGTATRYIRKILLR